MALLMYTLVKATTGALTAYFHIHTPPHLHTPTCSPPPPHTHTHTHHPHTPTYKFWERIESGGRVSLGSVDITIYEVYFEPGNVCAAHDHWASCFAFCLNIIGSSCFIVWYSSVALFSLKSDHVVSISNLCS